MLSYREGAAKQLPVVEVMYVSTQSNPVYILFSVLFSGAVLTACSSRELATGIGAGGAAYEYSNKRAMDQLEEDYRAGRIGREEYERRKHEIEGRSLIY